MSIKIIDQLQPLGDFSVVDASDVGVGNERLSTVLENKVDKVSGKGLSTNDYTTTEKNKLFGIADNANNYVHPTTSGNKHIPAGGAEGKILGWDSDGTAKWVDDHNTEYNDATTSVHGLMSAADKAKLNGIAAGATAVTVDSAFSDSSSNPVQNQIVTAKINEIENRIFYVTPEMFNAVGDGSTDDTIAFLSMFSYARENDVAIRIPAKRYKITSSLEVSDLTIVGTSPSSNGADYGSTIVYTGIGYTFFTEAHKRAFISNIQFVGNGQNNGLNIKQYSGYEGYYDCLSFMNFMTAIRVDGNDNRFTRIQIIQCGDVSCSASDTPNYAIVSSLGLQNYFENCHIEHTRYMVSGVSSSLFFVNCKFEQSTYGIASANLSNPITVGGFCAFNACYFVTITIAAYIKASIAAADAPYFVSIANSTIVSGCTFIVGMGSGNYKHTSPNYTTGKFITSTRGNVSGNYFGTITRQAPAFALSYGAFCNNSIYVANAGEPTETVRTTLSDTVIFLGNAAANGAISDIFIISETGINNFLTVGFAKTGSYTIRYPYVIKSDGYSLRFAMHITSIMLPVGWTELGTLATDNLSFRNAIGKVFMAIIKSDDNTTDYGVVPLIIRESGKLEVYNNGDVPTDVNVRISTDVLLPV
jgi:hypothetical protein